MKTYFTKSIFIIAAALSISVFSYLVWGISGPEADRFNGPVNKWVGTWSTAPQLVEPRNMPPEPGLSHNTLRQVLRVSLGGDSLRVKLSNEFSHQSTVMQAVEIASSAGGSFINVPTIKKLTFNGEEGIVIPSGSAVTSDPIAFNLKAREDLAITIHFGATPKDLTGHPGSRTTSYIAKGDKTSAPNLSEATKTDHWYIIRGLDVKAPETAAAVAIFGNSITDGRGPGINKQNRWPDILAERLLENPGTQQVGVLNQGIGGNCVLKACLGPSALDRFDRDILDQQGVRWVIIMEGVNDLGGIRDSTEAFTVAKDLMSAYSKMIDKAHAEDIKVYGGTITPIKNSFYYTDYSEAARSMVNEWIRNSGRFDAVIDFDKAIRNPKDTLTILPEAHSGDFLHPNELGYEILGRAVDLSLFQ
jgi:lysophospholipase L1-like esterase